ncbi:hypothetical protein O3P69_014072 [Scylla paramamosain]|uniref:Uncharacterized protein n=1 Tax=Scylla paramamosain TaxID=85552 RepID=A0AAW0SSV7_SCYPA
MDVWCLGVDIIIDKWSLVTSRSDVFVPFPKSSSISPARCSRYSSRMMIKQVSRAGIGGPRVGREVVRTGPVAERCAGRSRTAPRGREASVSGGER